ncbi:hypothetical protein ACFQ08_36050 [Streptosporangium algeriense]|uniref:Secreted protein n=1 Tax=Streptosporangium algeriense TaxID=1682748 RepID=A0ABW3E4I4_9ACTN
MRPTHPLPTAALAVLAALVTAAAVVLVLPGSAWAAKGALWINGRRHHNPSGCYTVMGPLSAINRTNTAAVLYKGDRCNHRILGALGPAQRNTWEFVGSVSID